PRPGTAARPAFSRNRAARGKPASPRAPRLSRPAAPARLALRRLLYDDGGELAADRPDANERRLHRRRPLRLRDDGRLCRRSALRRLDYRRLAPRSRPPAEPAAPSGRATHGGTRRNEREGDALGTSCRAFAGAAVIARSPKGGAAISRRSSRRTEDCCAALAMTSL